jgi:UDP-N-acetylmuramate: L-alanyl-gamma-D-glutamyl-meso-diaminopimelate ligase
VYEDLESMVTAIAAAAKTGDYVLAMSNGGFGGVHQKILDALQEKSA